MVKGMATDHEGKCFPDEKAMIKHWGIPFYTYNYRKKNNWPLKKILTTPVKQRKTKTWVDHLGNTYRTQLDMCEHYGVDITTYNTRLNRGDTVEEALTGHVYYDHENAKYKKSKDMCENWGISTMLYRNRRQSGWTKKEALTGIKEREKTVEDFAGNKFFTQKDKCEYYGITYPVYHSRIINGWSEKKALTTPLRSA